MLQVNNGRYSAAVLLPVVLLISVVLGGCAVSPGSEPKAEVVSEPSMSQWPVRSTEANARTLLVVRDLVNALVQIPALNPDTTRLIFAKPDSNYGRVLAQQLQRAGYDMRISANPSARHYLTYTISSTQSDPQSGYEFTISVGNIKVRRQYALEGSRIFPVSSLWVFGASPENMTMDDSIFEQPTEPESRWTELTRTPDKLTATPENNQLVRSPENRIKRPRIEVPEKKNMYETRVSNFAGQTADYDDVQKMIITFPNDSTVLGRFNRELTREMAKDFNPETDLISVIGCSHGKTNIQNGNKKLALGRSERVRDELIWAGVDKEFILDEGCWAPRHFDEVWPRRAVVLTLKRLAEAS